MQNPILNLLGANKKQNDIIRLVNMLQTKNPNELYNQLLDTNPQFAEFVNANQGKTAEQIAQENGIDINMLRQFMNKF